MLCLLILIQVLQLDSIATITNLERKEYDVRVSYIEYENFSNKKLLTRIKSSFETSYNHLRSVLSTITKFVLMPAKLKKSSKDKMLAGVCGGLAEYLGWDATIVRILFVILAFTYGFAILAYFILAVVMPD